jgi:hypothetical protein
MVVRWTTKPHTSCPNHYRASAPACDVKNASKCFYRYRFHRYSGQPGIGTSIHDTGWGEGRADSPGIVLSYRYIGRVIPASDGAIRLRDH